MPRSTIATPRQDDTATKDLLKAEDFAAAMEDKDSSTPTPPPKKKAKINTWTPGKTTTFVERDGKLFQVNFDKIFNNPKFKKWNKFVIYKKSYENQLDTITRYTNFFIHFYDTDQELPLAYLKLKLTIDKDNIYGKDDMYAFIDYLYQIMFTPTMVAKIKKMVDDNYLDDIENGYDEKKKYYKQNEKKHLESLEFTNQHIKILLAISFGMKIMCPVMFHFCVTNEIKIDKTNLVIYDFYKPLFDLFNEDCNMYNKLYVYVSCWRGSMVTCCPTYLIAGNFWDISQTLKRAH